VLTVDYDRLGIVAGERLLDLGCGFGRHAYEGLRRGARVVACDLSETELKDVRATFEAMHLAGEAPPQGMAVTTSADATALPYPDGTFDRIIASEVLEHILDDLGALRELTRVLRPGGAIAVTVPTFLPEQICWRLSDQYHAPAAIGGHVRIYTKTEVRAKLRAVGLQPTRSHREHSLHSPYWWLKCAVGPNNDDHPLVRAYHRLLVWDIEQHPTVTRLGERVLNPVLGKSLVVYATKPIAVTRPDGATASTAATPPRGDVTHEAA